MSLHSINPVALLQAGPRERERERERYQQLQKTPTIHIHCIPGRNMHYVTTVSLVEMYLGIPCEKNLIPSGAVPPTFSKS